MKSLSLFKKRYLDQFKECNLPCPYFVDKKNLSNWLYYNKKKKNFVFKDSLQKALEDFIKPEMVFHYQANIWNEEFTDRPTCKIMLKTVTSFEEVVRALYNYPDTFIIPKEHLKDYSKQELDYLMHLQKYFHVIGLKDEKRSTNKVTSLKKNKRFSFFKWLPKKRNKKLDKIRLEEKISRYNNSKSSLYRYYHIMREESDSAITSILKEEYDYRLYRKEYKKTRVGERCFLVDKDSNYRAILEFVSEEVFPFRDLTEDRVDYKSSGYKNFKDYKNDLYQKFLEDSKWRNEKFDDNATICYVRFKIVETIKNNRTK